MALYEDDPKPTWRFISVNKGPSRRARIAIKYGPLKGLRMPSANTPYRRPADD